LLFDHLVSEREQIVYRLYKSPSPYSDQRALTRASSSGDGRTVGGKRSPPHSGRRGCVEDSKTKKTGNLSEFSFFFF
jgi:hypothetical protein